MATVANKYILPNRNAKSTIDKQKIAKLKKSSSFIALEYTIFINIYHKALYIANKNKTPACMLGFYFVDPRGFEPPASSVQMRRSSQLSYGPNNQVIGTRYFTLLSL